MTPTSPSAATSHLPGVAPSKRVVLHLRQIEMRGFQREDGLYEVEGRVVDRKAHDFTNGAGSKTVPAGQPIHDLGVRIVFDDDMLVHDVQSFTTQAPYPACPDGGQHLQSLRGAHMSKGWSREVRARLPAAGSCTHLVELLAPLATTAFQTVAALRMALPERLAPDGRPVRIDSCHAYAANGELVRNRWPVFHAGAASTDGSA